MNRPPAAIRFPVRLPENAMREDARLLGIAIRSAVHGAMIEVDSAEVTTARGAGSDSRGKPGRRQVTVLTCEGWNAALNELGSSDLPWTARRANLLVHGVNLAERIGGELMIGDAVLAITGETCPCEVMDRAQPGLMRALAPDWRAGVTCRVLKSGTVRIGSPVSMR